MGGKKQDEFTPGNSSLQEATHEKMMTNANSSSLAAESNRAARNFAAAAEPFGSKTEIVADLRIEPTSVWSRKILPKFGLEPRG